jgi:hypothetical protein
VNFFFSILSRERVTKRREGTFALFYFLFNSNIFAFLSEDREKEPREMQQKVKDLFFSTNRDRARE